MAVSEWRDTARTTQVWTAALAVQAEPTPAGLWVAQAFKPAIQALPKIAILSAVDGFAKRDYVTLTSVYVP